MKCLLYVRNALTRLVNILVREGLTIVALFVTMICLDWQLSLIAFTVLPLALIPISMIGKRLRKVSKRTQEQTGDMASLTVETFGAARTVKTYKLEPYLAARRSPAGTTSFPPAPPSHSAKSSEIRGSGAGIRPAGNRRGWWRAPGWVDPWWVVLPLFNNPKQNLVWEN